MAHYFYSVYISYIVRRTAVVSCQEVRRSIPGKTSVISDDKRRLSYYETRTNRRAFSYARITAKQVMGGVTSFAQGWQKIAWEY